MKRICFILSILSVSVISYGQRRYSTINGMIGVRMKSDTLIDRKTEVKYILDSLRIIITAIDKNGKILWQADPIKDANVQEYRVQRPIIAYYSFIKPKLTRKREVIGVRYNNTQFGIVEKDTGKFLFLGQD